MRDTRLFYFALCLHVSPSASYSGLPGCPMLSCLSTVITPYLSGTVSQTKPLLHKPLLVVVFYDGDRKVSNIQVDPKTLCIPKPNHYSENIKYLSLHFSLLCLPPLHPLQFLTDKTSMKTKWPKIRGHIPSPFSSTLILKAWSPVIYNVLYKPVVLKPL